MLHLMDMRPARFLLGACAALSCLLLTGPGAVHASDTPTGFTYVVYYPEQPEVDLMDALRENPLIAKGMIELVDALPAGPDRPMLQAAWLDDARSMFPPPDLDALRQYGRGLDAGQAAALSESRRALVLEFGHPRSNAIIALALADTLVGALLEDYGGLPVDLAMRRAISPQRWQAGRIRQASEQGANVMDHVAVLAVSDGTAIRVVTSGMVKFGLPDLVVEHVDEQLLADVTWLVNALGQRLIEGQRPDKDSWFDLRLDRILQTTFKASLDKIQRPDAESRGRFRLDQAPRRDGDPLNHLVKIGFADFPGDDETARQAAAVRVMFGGDTVEDAR